MRNCLTEPRVAHRGAAAALTLGYVIQPLRGTNAFRHGIGYDVPIMASDDMRTIARLRAYVSENWLHWGGARYFGNSRLVKTSYFWFLFVPLVARWMAPFAGEQVLTILGTTFHVTIDLPFSWKLFWVMSVLFGTGQLVYAARCPKIIKRFSNYGEYRAAHVGTSVLAGMMELMRREADREMMVSFCKQLPPVALSSPDFEKCDIVELEKYAETMGSQLQSDVRSGHEDRANDTFDVTRQASERLRRKSFWCSAVCFVAASALFLWFLFENTCAAIDVIF